MKSTINYLKSLFWSSITIPFPSFPEPLLKVLDIIEVDGKIEETKQIVKNIVNIIIINIF